MLWRFVPTDSARFSSDARAGPFAPHDLQRPGLPLCAAAGRAVVAAASARLFHIHSRAARDARHAGAVAGARSGSCTGPGRPGTGQGNQVHRVRCAFSRQSDVTALRVCHQAARADSPDAAEWACCRHTSCLTGASGFVARCLSAATLGEQQQQLLLHEQERQQRPFVKLRPATALFFERALEVTSPQPSEASPVVQLPRLISPHRLPSSASHSFLITHAQQLTHTSPPPIHGPISGGEEKRRHKSRDVPVRLAGTRRTDRRPGEGGRRDGWLRDLRGASFLAAQSC